MLGILIFSAVLTYGTFALFHILGKVDDSINSVPRSSISKYSPNGENYNEPIQLLSHNNSASKITYKDGLFYITIENSITGDKKTLSHKNKKYLCWDAEDVATKFALRERDEFNNTNKNTRS